MRSPAHHTQTSGPMDPFGALHDSLMGLDVQHLVLGSAVDAGEEILGDITTTMPEEVAHFLTLDVEEDMVVIGVTEEGAPMMFEVEYGSLRTAGQGQIAMAEKHLQALASGYAARDISRAVTG